MNAFLPGTLMRAVVPIPVVASVSVLNSPVVGGSVVGIVRVP